MVISVNFGKWKIPSSNSVSSYSLIKDVLITVCASDYHEHEVRQKIGNYFNYYGNRQKTLVKTLILLPIHCLHNQILQNPKICTERLQCSALH